MTRRLQFASLWAVLTAVLIALLVIALTPVDPTGSPADAAGLRQAGGDAPAIRALVAAMEAAILAQDRDAYRACVDFSDPIFASEHGYWIEDWVESDPLDRLALAVDDIAVQDDRAVALLTVKWAALPDTSIRAATYPVLFVRDARAGWLFAGEEWTTLATEQFEVHAFPGMEEYAAAVAETLPSLYNHATRSLDYQPQTVMHIKLYDTRDTLGATVAFSLPPITGWNEPGESLKLIADPSDRTSLEAVLAHELTHFLTFDMANTSYGNVPWWLAEGIAEYVASEYWLKDRAERTVAFVQGFAADGDLAPWDRISDFETTPVSLWQWVYPQGYVFTRYVTETYGDDLRNQWLRAMTGDQDIAGATQTVLGMSFEMLDAAFLVWLADQPG